MKSYRGGEMRVLRIIFILIIALTIMPFAHAAETVQDSGVTESIQTIYNLESPPEGEIVLIYTYRNIREEAAFLNYSFDFLLSSANLKDLQISDSPEGYISYRFRDRDELLAISFGFARVFAPKEEYRVLVNIKIGEILERGNSKWIFRDIQTNLKDWPIAPLDIRLNLPKERLYTYDFTKIDPGGDMGLEKGRKSISWRREVLQPGDVFQVTSEFVSRPDWLFIALILLIISFVTGVIVMGKKSFLFKGGFIKSVPNESSMVEKIEGIVHGAQEEVLIISPWLFYVDWLTAMIKPLADRGIRIRIVTWPSYARGSWEEGGVEIKQNKKQAFALRRFLNMFPGDTVRLNDNAHSKLIIVDRKAIIASSANLTQTGLFMNYEAGIWVFDEALAGDGVAFFEKLWNADETIALSEETLDPSTSRKIIREKKKKVP
jgi:cardiolipin synthase